MKDSLRCTFLSWALYMGHGAYNHCHASQLSAQLKRGSFPILQVYSQHVCHIQSPGARGLAVSRCIFGLSLLSPFALGKQLYFSSEGFTGDTNDCGAGGGVQSISRSQ